MSGPDWGREELVDPVPRGDDTTEEAGLRPRSLVEFVGQPELKEHLAIIL